jgi:hypothetical protein
VNLKNEVGIERLILGVEELKARLAILERGPRSGDASRAGAERAARS